LIVQGTYTNKVEKLMGNLKGIMISLLFYKLATAHFKRNNYSDLKEEIIFSAT
jgi:hypothetical protein